MKFEHEQIHQKVEDCELDFFEFSYQSTNQYTNKVPAGHIDGEDDVSRAAVANMVQSKSSKKAKQRWLVLRGFILYVYKSTQDKTAMDVIPIKPELIEEFFMKDQKESPAMALYNANLSPKYILLDFVGS
mmetsp:Transcript_31123/g.28325  ORF Transcript_31123/g.28325 Transcript_31123/m.28325 type:complete len:130 (-) Transcript_31123:1021-1410(-)